MNFPANGDLKVRVPGGIRHMDRRRRPRYALRMRMSVERLDGEDCHAPAYTCNMSRTGILFQCSENLGVGQSIEYLIDLYPECSVQLRCRGKVVRWAASGPARSDYANLYAATIEDYECIRNSAGSEYRISEQHFVLR